jgi:HlyD family secretion protein
MEENNIELRSEEFQEILGSVPHWILRWGVTVLAAVVLILLAGSAVFKYPDIIPAPVVLTGSTPPATVVAHASGKLKELYVEDNQNVKKDDYLGIIDNPALTADIRHLKWYLDSLDLEQTAQLHLPDKNLKVGTLQNLYASFYVALFNYTEYLRQLYYPQKMILTKERMAQYEMQYENLLRQQKIMNEQFELTRKGYVRDSLLYLKGGVSGKELDNSKSQYLQSLLSQENMQSSLNSLRMQIDQLKESLFDTGYQDTEKGNSLLSQLQSLLSQLKTEIQAWELNYVLLAPIDGKVTFTNFWIENQNVVAGGEIFTIVPENEFSIIGKAMLPIARSGKVEPGQKANIRLENFPENEYGILRGVVQNISLVPVQQGETAYYILEIALPGKLQTTYKKELPYLPNMQGRADIITDDISLLERFILPVKKILTENL